MSEPLNRAELVEQAAVASYLQSEPQPDQFPWDRESGAMRNHHRAVGEAVAKVITRAITDRVRVLVDDWQAPGEFRGDGNNAARADCAEELRRLCDAIDAEMAVGHA